MDATQIHDALDRVFNEKKARIVFWNDPEREFVNTLPFLLLKDVNVLRLDEVGGLEAKLRIEHEDPEGRYLLYSPSEEPDYDEDWLLDIRLYSESFRADRASINLRDLGLNRQGLRDHIAKRRKFFDSRDRIDKLKRIVHDDDGELDLDRKMLAVVTRSDQPEPFNIVRTLFHAMSGADGVDLDVIPAVWDQVEKFDLDEPFWAMMHSVFGYTEESPMLKNLLIRLLVTDYAEQLRGELPNALQNLILNGPGSGSAVVCLAQWRDSSSKGGSYNLLSEAVAAIIHLADHLHGCEIEDLLDVSTFLDVEKAIVSGLCDRVSSTADTIDAERTRSIASRRQAGHWVSSASVPVEQRRARRAVYEALAVAAELFALRNQYMQGFDFPDAPSMYQAYEQELYRFDQLYRQFCENARIAKKQGWDTLKPLLEQVEAVYCNTYLTNLALAWGKFVSSGLLEAWHVDAVPNQQDFYARSVKPWLDESDKRRAFVIVSDALRYEVAQELTQELNGAYRFQAALSSQLGVLPSYTALGMASLLPHQAVEYSPKGEVLVDGKPTASLDQRGAVLRAAKGIAVKADALLEMRKEQGREFVSDARVVYVYHDEIDARGDKAATESDTFEACRKAIEEIAEVVRYIVNNLNGNYVVVTADHGFLFTETAPGETDKSKLKDEPSGMVKKKKRYLLGHDLHEYQDAWHGRTAATANAAGGMEFWIPKGANRFHFTGGARFIHGGAMPQEIVVPVVTVKHVKDKGARDKTKTKYVTVQVLGSKHKITAHKHRFTLVQMEKVGDRAKPITLKVAVYEGDQPVTSIEKLTFESTSDSMEDRQKTVTLTLKDGQYDKRKSYRLILRDAGTGVEQESVDVMIDRAIADDF